MSHLSEVTEKNTTTFQRCNGAESQQVAENTLPSNFCLREFATFKKAENKNKNQFLLVTGEFWVGVSSVCWAGWVGTSLLCNQLGPKLLNDLGQGHFVNLGHWESTEAVHSTNTNTVDGRNPANPLGCIKPRK